MKIRQTIAAAAFALTSLSVGSASAATTFDFTYKFATNSVGPGACCGGALETTTDVITGSFTGLLTGNDTTGIISDISNVTASYDGTPLGALYAGSYIGPANEGDKINFAAGGAVASFNPLANNFVFSTQPYSSAGWPGNYFYIIQPWNNIGPGSTDIAVQYSGPGGVVTEAFNGDYVPGNWSVSAVPEPATWTIMLIGFFGTGLLLRASRRKAAAFIS